MVTNTPLQGLFLMNSDLMSREADALVARLGPEPSTPEEQADRIQRAYRILYERRATPAEVERGLAFLKKAQTAAPPAKMSPWQQYAQALLSSGEFYYVN